jgi:hypothetical protein
MKHTREVVNVEISGDVHLGSSKRIFYQQFSIDLSVPWNKGTEST